MTAKADGKDVIAGLDAGADEYLTKPVDQLALVARVKSVLRIKELHNRVAAQAADLANWNKTLEQASPNSLPSLNACSDSNVFYRLKLLKRYSASGGESILDSHRRDITAVFCDVRGFTAFSETAEPEEVMSFLGEYHSCLGALIHKHQGTLERFTGDGLLILFNDPLRCDEPSLRAAQMAVEMREQVAILLSRWRKHGHELGFGMGASYGYATLGRIGYEGRFDYSAIGTVVNLAARLCAEARDGQILIDGKVKTAIEGAAIVEPTDELKSKACTVRSRHSTSAPSSLEKGAAGVSSILSGRD